MIRQDTDILREFLSSLGEGIYLFYSHDPTIHYQVLRNGLFEKPLDGYHYASLPVEVKHFCEQNSGTHFCATIRGDVLEAFATHSIQHPSSGVKIVNVGRTVLTSKKGELVIYEQDAEYLKWWLNS